MAEQRRTRRLPVAARAFIEVQSPAPDGTDAGRLVVCTAMDMSQDGLRASLDEPLPEGAILQIGVDLPGRSDTLYLVGEVRWCQPLGDTAPRWRAGFHLLKATATDRAAWATLFAAMDIDE